jgi:hypothetical protein
MQETMFDNRLQPLDVAAGRTRHDDYATSKAGARSVALRAGSQKFALLKAFAIAGADGLADDEAAAQAGLALTSCYWKRCGELRALDYIRFTGDERVGMAGVERMVSAITAAGRAVVA